MYGLRLIDSGTCSLIENMAIVIVPLYVAVLAGKPPKKKTILCAVGSSLGIFLTILAALTYAACILATEKVSRNADGVTIGIIQLGVMGILLIAVPTGGHAFLKDGYMWALMLFLVLICSCFGFAFQHKISQKQINETLAKSILCC